MENINLEIKINEKDFNGNLINSYTTKKKIVLEKAKKTLVINYKKLFDIYISLEVLEK